MHHLLPGGAHGIAPPSGALVFATGLVEQSVVQVQGDGPLWVKGPDRQLGQQTPQLGHGPRPAAKEAVIGVVSAIGTGFGQQVETSQSMSSRAADPGAEQADPEGEARGGEDRLKESQEVEPPIEVRVHRGEGDYWVQRVRCWARRRRPATAR